jgi:hypothetical protein
MTKNKVASVSLLATASNSLPIEPKSFDEAMQDAGRLARSKWKVSINILEFERPVRQKVKHSQVIQSLTIEAKGPVFLTKALSSRRGSFIHSFHCSS